MAESDLWARIIASLRGDTYVPELRPAEDPTLSDWERTALRRKQEEALRRQRLGLDQLSPEPMQEELGAAVTEPLVRTPGPNDITVERLKAFAMPKEGEPLGRSTDYVPRDKPKPSSEDETYPYDYDPAEYLRNYAANMDPDKLARIRAQAVAKGRRGSLEGGQATGEDFLKAAFGGGGSFSQQEESPELTQRLAERDQFIAGQDLRDARWDRDLARQRRDPAAKKSAEETIMGLQQQAFMQSKQDAINSLLANVSDKTGKIDPETYQKLGMLGQYVPSSMVGKSKEQTISEFDQLIARGSEKISELAPQAAFDTSGEVTNRVAAERKGVQLLTQLKQMVASGQMTGEEASALFQQAMMMDKYVQGWIAERMMPNQIQQQQGE